MAQCGQQSVHIPTAECWTKWHAARLTCEFAQENTMSQHVTTQRSIRIHPYSKKERQPIYKALHLHPAPGLAHPTPSGQTNSKQDHTVHMCWFCYVLSSGIF